jgi:MoxR-like ATPase
MSTPETTTPAEADIETITELAATRARLVSELGKIIIGQRAVIDQLLTCLFARGHALLMGVPGLAKTLLIQSLSQLLDLRFSRIQFTPDLMPSDITGTEILQETDVPGRRAFEFVPGPLFANIILADEINRTPPKTQAALLQAMQERRINSGKHQFELDAPFFVLATQNPIEQEGTYPLPEAQLDRFMFLIQVGYPSAEEELQIAKATTGLASPVLEPVLDAAKLLRFQDVVRRVPVPEHVYLRAVQVVRACRPTGEESPAWLRKWVAWGPGPRAVQSLVLGAKARAVLEGSFMVRREDLDAVAEPVLSHRIFINFQAESEGIDSAAVIRRVLAETRS